jgi:hypothetical protein
MAAKVGTSKTLGQHNKPTGWSASGAYALGPDEKKKKKQQDTQWQADRIQSLSTMQLIIQIYKLIKDGVRWRSFVNKAT